ncbi:MAG: hypothetical protein PW792_02710 [Acidobacteriaceae bacterium]|nr:hypothetical protein [Acidobacteriaceae bacterium]
MSAFWNKLFNGDDAPQLPPDVSADAEALTVAEMEGEEAVYVRVPWSSITAILAHKDDVFGVAQLRLEVLTDITEAALLITEDDTGFAEFAPQLTQHLPGLDPAWREEFAAMPVTGEAYVLFRRA